MSEQPLLPTTDLASVRELREKINAHLASEMAELGADPVAVAKQAMTMGGVEFFEQWLQPKVPPPPPIVVLLGLEWVELAPGHAVLSCDPAEWMLNPLGVIHGGIAATLLDTVTACAVHTTLPAGTGYATSDLHVRFVRAMQPDIGRLIATGSVIHAGRRHSTAEGRLEAEATGKLIATATAGCAILPPS
jgi:uncharacterized protein (TIGR00369 family)